MLDKSKFNVFLAKIEIIPNSVLIVPINIFGRRYTSMTAIL